MQCPYLPGDCFVLLWKYSMEDHRAIARPDYPQPKSISIIQDELVAVLQFLAFALVLKWAHVPL
jgi:hypothetical protein